MKVVPSTIKKSHAANHRVHFFCTFLCGFKGSPEVSSHFLSYSADMLKIFAYFAG